MSKTTVDDLVDDIKVLSDYNISDTALDTLIIKAINFGLKRLKQWFLDEGLYRQITGQTTLKTVALQEFIDISSVPADLDMTVVLTERVNDTFIPIISYTRYKEITPDPTAYSASTPDAAAIFNDRLFLTPTPSEILTIHFGYVKLITKVISGNTLPFDDKYDELLVAIGIEYLVKFLDRNNAVALASTKRDVNDLYDTLIVRAAKNVGLRQGSASRRGEIPFFSPRRVV